MLQNTTGSCDVITVTYFLFVEEGAASFRHEVSVDAVHDEDAARVTSPDQLHLIAAKVFSRIRSESCLQETRMLLYFIAFLLQINVSKKIAFVDFRLLL